MTGTLSNQTMSTFSLTDDSTGETKDYLINDDTAINMANGRTDGEKATVTYTVDADGNNIALTMTAAK